MVRQSDEWGYYSKAVDKDGLVDAITRSRVVEGRKERGRKDQLRAAVGKKII